MPFLGSDEHLGRTRANHQFESLPKKQTYLGLTGLQSFDKPVLLLISFEGTGLISSQRQADSFLI